MVHLQSDAFARHLKTLLAVVSTLLTCSTVAASDGLDRVTRKLEQGEPVRLAATGDSITFLCFHTDAKRNYLTFTADALRQAYPRAKIELTVAGNLGVTGSGLPKLVDSVLKEKPDLVFVMFGMNDCAEGPGGLDRYDANLTQFIRQIRQSGAEPVILTQNTVVDDSLDGQRRRALPLYMQRAVEVAAREKTGFVDLHAAWQRLVQEKPIEWTRYLNDAIHPNVAGHRFFASEILAKLWPEAARFQSAELRQPLPPAMRQMEPRLLPGPIDKQLLRTDATTWVAITAGYRDGIPTDLVLWISHGKPTPQWSDFRPTVLVGQGEEAVFLSHETPINSGLLLLRSDGRLFVLFSQTVGVYALAVDTMRPEWWQTLSDSATFKPIQAGSLPQPESLRGSYQADCEVIDARLDDRGMPQYLRRDLLLAAGGSPAGKGIIAARYSADAREYLPNMVLPDCRVARTTTLDDGSWYVVGQCEPNSPLTAAIVDRGSAAAPQVRAADFLFGRSNGRLCLLVLPEGNAATWTGYQQVEDRWEPIDLPEWFKSAGSIAAVPLADGSSSFWAIHDARLARCQQISGSPEPSSMPFDLPPRVLWRWEERRPIGVSTRGILWQDGQGLLAFDTVADDPQ